MRLRILPLAADERVTLGPKESYDRYFDWERLLRDVLVPLSTHSRARYQRYDWVTDALVEWHEVEPRPVVIVEGCLLDKTGASPIL